MIYTMAHARSSAMIHVDIELMMRLVSKLLWLGGHVRQRPPALRMSRPHLSREPSIVTCKLFLSTFSKVSKNVPYSPKILWFPG